MNRIKLEKDYWNKAALDLDVDKKYICDIPNEKFRHIPPIVSMSNKYLDLGCGVGRLMENFDNFYGIDISENMLEIARKRKPNCNFKLTDGRTIPYEDNYFDFVYCVLLFQHLPLEGVSAYIKESARVLKKGGRFIFQYIEGKENEPFSKHYRFYHFNLDKFKVLNKQFGLIHPQWTWIEAKKI